MGLDINLFSHFIIIVYVAIAKKQQHNSKNAYGSITIVEKPCFWHYMNKAANIEHEEQHHQIQQDEDKGKAHFINCSCRKKWHFL